MKKQSARNQSKSYLHVLLQTEQGIRLAKVLDPPTLRNLHESSPRATFPVAGRAEGRDEAVVQQVLDDCVQGPVVLREERKRGRKEREIESAISQDEHTQQSLPATKTVPASACTPPCPPLLPPRLQPLPPPPLPLEEAASWPGGLQCYCYYCWRCC